MSDQTHPGGFPKEDSMMLPERRTTTSAVSTRRTFPIDRPRSGTQYDSLNLRPPEFSRPESDLSRLKDSAVVAVMGVTGSGKSTFISLLADQPIEVGHTLRSSTVTIDIYSYTERNGKTTYLIDTPGFDDTDRSDAEIFKDIAYFLASLHANRIRLSGIIYLHRITDPRMQGSALKNLRIIQKLCGEENFRHIVLTTTMWEDIERTNGGQRLGDQRQSELFRPEFWGAMIDQGSIVRKHDGSRESARNLVTLIVDAGADAVLAIQRELVDQNLRVDETTAGQYVFSDWFEAKRKFEKELSELEDAYEDALREKNVDMAQTIEAEKHATLEKARRLDYDAEGLRITMQQLAREKQPQYQELANQLHPRRHPTPERHVDNDSSSLRDPVKDPDRRSHYLAEDPASPQARTSRQRREERRPSREYRVQRRSRAEDDDVRVSSITAIVNLLAGFLLGAQEDEFLVIRRGSRTKSWGFLE